MAGRGKLLLLVYIFTTAYILGNVECFRTNQPETPTMCDASQESTEECDDANVHLSADTPITLHKPKFLLYKYHDSGRGRYVPISMDERNISDANPQKGAPWKILIHGFLNNANTMFPVNVRDAYVQKSLRTKEIFNILVVDWGDLACLSVPNAQGYIYDYAAKNTEQVGIELGKLIVYMHEKGILNATTDVHIIGHSLGAHVSGQAGREVFDMLGTTVRRISGLDPAGPAFWANRYIPKFMLKRRRLQRKDTQFADIYHSDPLSQSHVTPSQYAKFFLNGPQTSSLFGTAHPMGDVDFWINGGTFQPSCVPKAFSTLGFKDYIQVCSHNYATTLFAKTVSDASMSGCLCDYHWEYYTGACNCEERAVVGEMIDSSHFTVGEFYYDAPRDDSVIEALSWRNFSLKKMIKEIIDMVCK